MRSHIPSGLHMRAWWPVARTRLSPWLGVVSLAAWAAHPWGPLLAVAALAFVVGMEGDARRRRLRAIGSLALLAGVLAGFAAHRDARDVQGDFEAYWARREAAIGTRLQAALEDRLQAAEGAADALAAQAADSVPRLAEPLARLRAAYGVTALALYGPQGELLVWDGLHRGQVPEEVQRGLRRYAYGDLPLFGYLYVTAPTGSGATAVAAVLLRVDLPGPLAAEAGDFASEFRRDVGERIRLVREAREENGPAWDWTLGDRTLFTVILDPPSPGERAREILDAWRVRVGGLAVLAWILFALAAGSHLADVGLASATLVTAAGLLPFRELPGLAFLFDPGSFSLPGPVPVTLGRLAMLVLSLAMVASVVPPPPIRLRSSIAGAATGGLFAVLLGWMAAGASPESLAQGRIGWIVFQGTATIFLALVAGTALAGSRGARHAPEVWHAVAITVAAALAVGTVLWVRWVGGAPWWWPALWALPIGLAATAPLDVRPRGRLASWVVAGILAGSVAIPTTWAERVEARTEIGAAYLNQLAAPEDPALEEALWRLSDAAVRLSAQGDGGVDVLYGAWRRSGLADLGAPAWLTLWSAAGIPEQELRVGVTERPVVAYEVQEDAGSPGAATLLHYHRDDARYVLRVTLEGGSILTAAAPPFADPTSTAGLSPLLGGGEEAAPALTLIPRASWEGSRQGLRWSRWGSGWRAELPLTFSNALYRAHYTVQLPGVLPAVGRATLLLVANVLVLLLFRSLGRGLLRDYAPGGLRLRGVPITFRARVTFALFGFFVLAVALFGTLAYRTIAGASARAAQVLAQRVAEDAAGWYTEVSGRMQALSRRVGVELLEYRRGELYDGSVEELVELGLYEAWLPLSTYRLLERGDDVRAFEEVELGTWSYVSAFRRLPDGDILSAQVPRQAGATALGTADVLEFLAFAVLVGAALSLALALLVGRALTRPIQALQVASEHVGAGNLALRLPADRADEFGSVFRAFNRMVGRLRRARRQLVRTTRRTQAIMEEAAVGMVALDGAGRVTLVNPRAEALLDEHVTVGKPLPAGGSLGEELLGWLEGFLVSNREEAHVELQDGARRIRVRARRLGTRTEPGGAVVALEDVTDELRTERVLAWGEMARQVAHEVKNPLTPMKLSLQHIRRAWEDRRTDFDSILAKNADAVLEEIDRLAAIAKSFSRFGAPSAEGIPLEPVDVGRVVREVLALYRGSEGPVRFEAVVPEGLPPVRARATEMKEVLVNLLENARIASPLGGTVRVEAATDAEGGLTLCVVDSGKGIPEGFRARVFEPQFSTRSTGAGLGLAIVRRLVESWGGTVGLESREGQGTRVRIRIRRWAAEPDREG